MPDLKHDAGSGSAVAIGGHPLHPFFAPLPIGSLVCAFLADLAYPGTADTFWARGSLALLGFGLVTGLIAGLLGMLEAMSVRRARETGLTWVHGAMNILALIVSAASFKLRWDATFNWVEIGPYLSGMVAALLLISGWIGGEMTFKRGIGVSRAIGVDREP